MSFGKLLREMRLRNKMKQSEVGDFLGVSDSMIGHYENDRRMPDMEIIERLSKLFNVPVGYWFNEEPIISDDKNAGCANTYKLLKYLHSRGIIEDLNNVDKETLDLIIETINRDLQEIKKA